MSAPQKENREIAANYHWNEYLKTHDIEHEVNGAVT